MNIDVSTKIPMEGERTQADRFSKDIPRYSAAQGSTRAEQGVITRDKNHQEEKAIEPDVEMHTEMDLKDMAAVVEELNEAMPLRARQLQFAINEDANRTVISVLDKESGDMIRQLPSKEALELVIRLREAAEGSKQSVGVLVDSII